MPPFKDKDPISTGEFIEVTTYRGRIRLIASRIVRVSEFIGTPYPNGFVPHAIISYRTGHAPKFMDDRSYIVQERPGEVNQFIAQAKARTSE